VIPGLRLLTYDANRPEGEALLRSAWSVGARLYRGARRVDAHFGARSWKEALAWLASYGPGEPIAEVQHWSHGNWGRVVIGDTALDRASVAPAHDLRPLLDALRDRLAPDALVWFRTCDAFGARAGHDLAMALSDHLGARVAGHTYTIHALQSGLHGLLPGSRPHWPLDEGILEGTPEAPRRSKTSVAGAPNTLTFLHGRVPDAWFHADP
jgi:hypothetical protein